MQASKKAPHKEKTGPTPPHGEKSRIRRKKALQLGKKVPHKKKKTGKDFFPGEGEHLLLLPPPLTGHPWLCLVSVRCVVHACCPRSHALQCCRVCSLSLWAMHCRVAVSALCLYEPCTAGLPCLLSVSTSHALQCCRVCSLSLWAMHCSVVVSALCPYEPCTAVLSSLLSVSMSHALQCCCVWTLWDVLCTRVVLDDCISTLSLQSTCQPQDRKLPRDNMHRALPRVSDWNLHHQEFSYYNAYS